MSNLENPKFCFVILFLQDKKSFPLLRFMIL